MNEKITVLIIEGNEMAEKIGEMPVIENEDFYDFFKNLNISKKYEK